MVSDITGLYGAELGQFIRNFKAHIGNELFTYWVLASNSEDIVAAIKSFKQ